MRWGSWCMMIDVGALRVRMSIDQGRRQTADRGQSTARTQTAQGQSTARIQIAQGQSKARRGRTDPGASNYNYHYAHPGSRVPPILDGPETPIRSLAVNTSLMLTQSWW